ncbi:hypothetical protein KHF85_19575 [Xanthomonas translucens pv. graminis]|uniref:hypothetical protein n=1 Tax=Xanthomonas graminis TaxID=3390026 RepID=UPI00254061DD|nr:hypothetical protein [Xanthomonas translucens]WIH04915.1 hypothetical protein KHF85_19575 [Xanthomonas translucens pv. graminis]
MNLGLERGQRKYFLKMDISSGPVVCTISLNPSYGFKIKSSGETQSPKVNGGHEISHAAEHDRTGDQAFGKALERPTNPDGTKGVSPEENRATKVEQKIGKDLSEPTRKDYRDAGDYVKCNPTAATGCK